MNSKNEDQLIPKVEPINVNFIKKEKNEIEEELFVFPGLVKSLEINKVSVKKELYENEEIENYSSTKVWNNFIIFFRF